MTDEIQNWVQKKRSNAMKQVLFKRLYELNIELEDFIDNVNGWSKSAEFGLTS